MSQGQYSNRDNSVVSIGDWVVTLILMIIPLVNVIMLFIWGFGGNVPESKANWAKATLIFMAISLVLTIVMWSTVAAIFLSAARF